MKTTTITYSILGFGCLLLAGCGTLMPAAADAAAALGPEQLEKLGVDKEGAVEVAKAVAEMLRSQSGGFDLGKLGEHGLTILGAIFGTNYIRDRKYLKQLEQAE
jgi:hypothetical protein